MRLVIAACAFMFALNLDIDVRKEGTSGPALVVASHDSAIAASSNETTAKDAGDESSPARTIGSHIKIHQDRVASTDDAIKAAAQISEALAKASRDGMDETDTGETPRSVTMDNLCKTLAAAAEEHGIPVAFFARLIWQESRFKPDAVSHVGARGVAQFMPATARAYGLDDPHDPRQALPASARFLRELHDQFGNLGLAAAAYNAGPGRIQNWLARRGGLPTETRNYVKIITGEKAESWTVDSNEVELHTQLPRNAPCEGVAGLSRSSETETVTAVLAPAISELISKAQSKVSRVAAVIKKKQRGGTRLALLKKSKSMAQASRKELARAGIKTASAKVKLAAKSKSSRQASAAKVRLAAADR